MSAVTNRMEHDLPDNRKVLATAYFDVDTLRALEISISSSKLCRNAGGLTLSKVPKFCARKC